MKKTFVCMGILLSTALCAVADPLAATVLDELIAKPARVVEVMRGLKPEAQRTAAREILLHAAEQSLSSEQKKQILAKLTAACIAAVAPSERANMARALVEAGGKENVTTVVAAIALAAGADEAGKAVVEAAVETGEDIAPGGKATEAAQSPDAVLGTELSTEVVQTVQDVVTRSVPQAPAPPTVPTTEERPEDEPEEQQPIAAPPTPPRAHPYEAQ